jgi:comEA protein
MTQGVDIHSRNALPAFAGAAKWAAVLIVGAACGAGGYATWATFFDKPTPRAGTVVIDRAALPEAQRAEPVSVPQAIGPIIVQVMPHGAMNSGEAVHVSVAHGGEQEGVEDGAFMGPPRPLQAGETRPLLPTPVSPHLVQTPQAVRPQTLGTSGTTGTTGAPGPSEAQPAPTATRRININSAPKEELELLPGVGPAMAQRIIDHRRQHGPFKSVQALDDVRGIGPKTLEKLMPLITIEPERKPR